MDRNDAIEILGIVGEINEKTIKKFWRAACSKYHPDKGGSVEMMQAVNQAYESLKGFEGYAEAKEEDSGNYGEALNEAINKIIHLEGIKIEVCGAWVWVTGNTKQYKDILGRKNGGAGFYYASKKQAWYFRPEGWKSKGRGKWSMDDIRSTHGSNSVRRRQAKEIEAA